MQNLLNRILRRFTTNYHRFRYMQAARQILQTPPLKEGRLPFMTLSMVQKRDVIPYLVAIKSFAHFLQPQHVTIVCDPSIDDADLHILRKHVPFAEFRQAQEFQNNAIPKGGCWERLAAIASYSTKHYVVQLDADTLTIEPLPEVEQAILSNQGFVLGERSGQLLMTLEQTELNAREWNDKHIQSLSEKKMLTAGLSLNQYVRGCAGFTGFPSNMEMTEQMFEFSSKMANVVSGRWTEWGTEQVASNYIVANARGTSVLPYPKYSTPESEVEDIAFFHFIGYVRYVNNMYRSKTQQVLQFLETSP